MRRRKHNDRRSGGTLVETAITLSVFLLMVLGMLDLSVAVFRMHLLTEAARQGTRQTIVHGSLAAAAGSWGPQTIGPVAVKDAGPLGEVIQAHLTGMDPAAVMVLVEWLDGSNQPDMRVRITLTYPHQPIMVAVLGSNPLGLTATSTMRIAH